MRSEPFEDLREELYRYGGPQRSRLCGGNEFSLL